MREQGLSSSRKIEKPFLNEKTIKARFQFAQNHKDWRVSDWKRVVFSDETKIYRFSSDGRAWCWIEDKKSFLYVLSIKLSNMVESILCFGFV